MYGVTIGENSIVAAGSVSSNFRGKTTDYSVAALLKIKPVQFDIDKQ